MQDFFGFLLFVSIALLITGLIKPEIVIRWGQKKDRQEVGKYFGTSTMVSFFLIAIFNSGSPSRVEDNKFPYKFVKSQDQQTGRWKDTMDLYYCSDPIDPAQLKKFCSYKKDGFSSDGTYYLVIFNDEKNVVFPKDPFGAEYGMQEDVLKNIKAFYFFRKPNGVSKLSYYEKNKLESKAQEEKI